MEVQQMTHDISPTKVKYTDHKHCDEGCKFTNPETSICDKHNIPIEPYQICVDEKSIKTGVK